MALPPGTSGWIGSGFDCQGDCIYGTDCCPKPVVILENSDGTDTPTSGNARYFISDATTAEITVQCGSSSPSTTSITLVDGMASAVYDTAGQVCFIQITATNSCGTTTRYWRNYTTPKDCDCINVALDPPRLWGRAGSIITTISGTAAAQPLVISGSTVCASPSACGDVSGSFVRPCGSPNKRYLVTSYTGCSDYHYYIDMLDSSEFLNWNFSSPYYASQIFLSSGWFQKASNPYPTLTEVTVGTNLATLLGVGSFNPRHNRDVNLQRTSALSFAPSNLMLQCYTGTLVGVGGLFASSYDNISNPGASNRGHCDCSGLTITAEVT